eukprot:4697025-Prymnesium_polylepis.1
MAIVFMVTSEGAYQAVRFRVKVPAELGTGGVVGDRRVCAGQDCPADVQKVVEVAVACGVGAVVHALGREPPHWLANCMRVVDGGLVIRVDLALALQGARVVSQQPEALPQKPVNLLAIARLEQVDVRHKPVARILTPVTLPRSKIGKPRAERMHVPPRRKVRLLILWDALERIRHADVRLDQVGSTDRRARRECSFQATAQCTRHGPSVGIVLLVGVVRPDGVLRVLVWCTFGRIPSVLPRAHQLPCGFIPAQFLVTGAAVIGEAPRAQQLRVPLIEIGVVWLRGVDNRHHAQRVHGAPQGRRVAVLFEDRRQCLLVQLGLKVDLRSDGATLVTPRWEGLREPEGVLADAHLQIEDKRLSLRAGPVAREEEHRPHRSRQHPQARQHVSQAQTGTRSLARDQRDGRRTRGVYRRLRVASRTSRVINHPIRRLRSVRARA